MYSSGDGFSTICEQTAVFVLVKRGSDVGLWPILAEEEVPEVLVIRSMVELKRKVIL